MAKPVLSKSTFLRGLKCEKNLWLYKNRYELKDEVSPQQQAIFKQGTEVGILAQQLFPGGKDATVPYYEPEKGIALTHGLIEEGDTVIYEAAFEYNGVYAAIDILIKDGEDWKAYEVKSSTSVKEVTIQDAAIQSWILLNSGLKLKDISIVHINNTYVKQGQLEIDKLFASVSVWNEIQNLLPDLDDKVQEFKSLIRENEEPGIDIGPYCFKPYDCDFMGYCWKHIPEYSIFDISGARKNKLFKLYDQGIITLDQIDLNQVPFSPNQAVQIECEQTGDTLIDRNRIQDFIDDLEYPLYFLDFETMSTAIPIYDNCRPFQQLVFQYSLHIQDSRGATLRYSEYLADANPDTDPRIGLVENLIQDCGKSGDILVYNIPFERGKINDAINQFAEYHLELDNILARLKDLMTPFKNKWYYTPDMKGSYSIKEVLPALVPELSYKDLDISEGETASHTFTQMVLGTFNGDLDQTRKDLLEYCKLDTLAMVKILEELIGIAKGVE